jgi:hypothetical protein
MDLDAFQHDAFQFDTFQMTIIPPSALGFGRREVWTIDEEKDDEDILIMLNVRVP